MCKHEEKHCPRCNTPFECKVGSIMLCQCAPIKLSQEERDYLQSQYDDCLCASCMQAMKREYHNKQNQAKMKRILGVYDNFK